MQGPAAGSGPGDAVNCARKTAGCRRPAPAASASDQKPSVKGNSLTLPSLLQISRGRLCSPTGSSQSVSERSFVGDLAYYGESIEERAGVRVCVVIILVVDFARLQVAAGNSCIYCGGSCYRVVICQQPLKRSG